MRTLLIGAKGMFGTDMVEDWAAEDLVPADSDEADIRNLDQVRNLASEVRPDWIVLAAAYTDVDGSERNAELAFAINGQGAENVARVAKEFGARILYVSTDYLFDGKSTRPYEPTDAIAPLNVYGASKAAGEKAIQSQAGEW